LKEQVQVSKEWKEEEDGKENVWLIIIKRVYIFLLPS
jgi:hypothetical protein